MVEDDGELAADIGAGDVGELLAAFAVELEVDDGVAHLLDAAVGPW